MRPRTRRAFLSVAATAVAAGCGAVGEVSGPPLDLQGAASVRWRTTIDGEPTLAAPPDPDAPVYAVTDAVRAFAREDGAPVGQFEPAGPPRDLTTDDAGVVVTTGAAASSAPSRVHALGPRCYHRWRADPGSGTPLIVDATPETVHVGTHDDTDNGAVDPGEGSQSVLALDRGDGSRRWTVDRTPDTRGGRRVGDRLLVRSTDGIFALTDDGSVAWGTVPSGRGDPVVAGGTVLTAGNDVVARSVSDGSARWRHDGAGANHVLAATPTRTFVGDEGGVTARSTADGSRRWRTTVDGAVENVAVVPGVEAVLAVTRGGRLHALDWESGKRRWTTALPLSARTEHGPGPWLWAGRERAVVHGQPAGSETPADQSDHGRTVALTVGGQRRWTATARQPVSGPLPASRGVYFVVGGAVLLVADIDQ